MGDIFSKAVVAVVAIEGSSYTKLFVIDVVLHVVIYCMSGRGHHCGSGSWTNGWKE